MSVYERKKEIKSIDVVQQIDVSESPDNANQED
jgi:hypothetical protein